MISLFFCSTAATLRAQHAGAAMEGKLAPAWGVNKWINLPDGKQSISLADYRGKALYLYFFQATCPGCHSHGFPTLVELLKRYKGNPDVEFVAIQTVFEGYQANTFANAKSVAQRYHLSIPVGHSGGSGKRSPLMARYRSQGTPWTTIIDRNGKILFSDFFVSPDVASTYLDQAVRADSREYAAVQARIPKSRGGQDMLGKPLALTRIPWLTKDGKPVKTRGKVTLVRWWTDTCPACARSLPAIEKLRKEFGPRGFQTIAIYHAKPPRDFKNEDVVKTARKLGYHGALAADPDWDLLYELYLGGAKRSATSVTFVLDRTGVVRFVHPGPVFGPSDKPGESRINQDYEDIRSAIAALLEK